MKKLLLIISLLLPFLYAPTSVSVAKEEMIEEKECSEFKSSIVKIVNNYNAFSGNGFVYKVDDKYMYVITSSKMITKVNNFSVIYSNNDYKQAILLGKDSYNEVAVFRTDKVENIDSVCFANSNYLYIGQTNYLYGYIDKEEDFFISTTLNKVGYLYSSKDYINVYKNVIQVKGSDSFNGVAVFDVYNRLVGMINGYNSKLDGHSMVVESNKLIKIADSIVKTGKYNVNYIKYKVADYGSLNTVMKNSYDISDSVDKGVAIITFKPLKFIFGGLNQGMVIVAVNGVEVKNVYEFDKQLMRYEKKDSVCLKVIKKSGKIAYYYVKV